MPSPVMGSTSPAASPARAQPGAPSGRGGRAQPAAARRAGGEDEEVARELALRGAQASRAVRRGGGHPRRHHAGAGGFGPSQEKVVQRRARIEGERPGQVEYGATAAGGDELGPADKLFFEGAVGQGRGPPARAPGDAAAAGLLPAAALFKKRDAEAGARQPLARERSRRPAPGDQDAVQGSH